jgi:hypothetical protein
LASPASGAAANGDVISEKPSGFVATAEANGTVLIVLTAPEALAAFKGRWGPVIIGKGNGTVLTLVHQAQAGRSVRIDLRTHRPGTASVTVPFVGHDAWSWHGTIVVK